MRIQWFPGHMAKALRMMQENLAICDCVGYVLDARAPFSCLNPKFDTLFAGKPCLFILNKADIADPNITAQWLNYFTAQGYKAVAVSSIKSAERKAIASAFHSLALPLVEKYKAKKVFKPIRAMITGVPNSGKSTLINCLSARKSVITGDKPGVTKGKQWVRLDEGLELLDTPGTLWPKFEDEQIARRLCYLGSVRDEVVDINELASLLLEDLTALYPQLLATRYRLASLDGNVLEEIARNRGFLLSGGAIDTERAARAVLDDFRKARIGRLTLEKPSSL